MFGVNEPYIIGNELRYLRKSINQNELSVGEFQKKFQKKLEKYCKSKYVTLCSSGTSALQVALHSLGIKENDEVIVPTFTFIATVNAVIYNKAIPVFMDCNDSCNLDINKFKKFIKEKTFKRGKNIFNKETKRRIFAIIPVHVWGGLVDLKPILKLCKDYNIKIIEDAAESLGSRFTKGQLKNSLSGTVGDMGCLSFNGNKIITSAGGGAILTKKKSLHQKANYLINQATDKQFNYIHNNVGYNFRMANINAAIGLAQLEKISFYIKRKKEINIYYNNFFKKFTKVKINQFPSYSKNNYWQTTMFINTKNSKSDIKKIRLKLKKSGFMIRQAWHPCHMQKPYKKYESFMIENASKISASLICLPCSSFLKKKQLFKISSIISKVLK